jgi:hypothetical protein
LFETLIGAIIQKRDVIEAENEMKKRDSVLLAPTAPAWSVQADREAADEKARQAGSGWSCCSI